MQRGSTKDWLMICYHVWLLKAISKNGIIKISLWNETYNLSIGLTLDYNKKEKTRENSGSNSKQ